MTSGVDRSRLQAVVEQPELYRVTLNGVELKALPDKHWIDPEMRFMPLGDAVRTGENVLTMECSPMRVLAEIEPIYILAISGSNRPPKGGTSSLRAISPPAAGRRRAGPAIPAR